MSTLEYDEFRITVLAEANGAWPLRIRSPAGDTRTLLTLPAPEDAAGGTIRPPAAPVAGGTDRAARDVIMSDPALTLLPADVVGGQLFNCLLHGEALSLWDRSVALADTADRGLRITLEIDPQGEGMQRVRALPWETLYDARTRSFIALSHRTPLVRFLNVPKPFQPQPVKPPFRVLVVMASPRGAAALDLDGEKNRIAESWGQRPDVDVDIVEHATRDSVRTALAQSEYHVLHFMGHGDWDSASATGMLLFESDSGDADAISGTALAVLVRDEPTLRLVFLNACNSAMVGDTISEDPFGGVASALLLAGVPAVVAMRRPVSDRAAIEFATTFYGLLPECRPVDWILAEARKAVYQAQERDGGDEWATPSLYLRCRDGVIFESMFRGVPVDAGQQRVLTHLGAKVRRFWIDGKLDQDIPMKPPIELDKTLLPKAVRNEWEGVVDSAAPDEAGVPPGKSITTLFDEKERTLLILGDPGYGKSISLLVLAQHLLRLYERDPLQPVPVVLFLSTWSDSGLSLSDWVVMEIAQKYKIPEKRSRGWLEGGRLVLMLDGLDEVAADRRAACVAAINAFCTQQIEQDWRSGVAVCCRYDEYAALTERFGFAGAVRLEPLTDEQIRAYIESAGARMAGLQALLEQDPELLCQAQSPLMLSMMSIAYGLSPDGLGDGHGGSGADASASPRDVLVSNYLDRAFRREELRDGPYQREEVTATLGWIARHLKSRHHSMFQIESLQPTWLDHPVHRLVNVVLYSLVFGLLLAVILSGMWLASGLIDPPQPVPRSADSYWFLMCPLWALLVALWDYRLVRRRENQPATPRPGLTRSLAEGVRRFAFYLGVWLLLWILLGVGLDWKNGVFQGLGLYAGLKAWISHPLTGGVIIAGLYTLRSGTRGTSEYIGTSEQLRWSWSGSAHGVLIGALAGLAFYGVQIALDVAESHKAIDMYSWFYPGQLGVIGFFFGGLRMGLVRSKTQPNEGIALSLRNGLVGALMLGPLLALCMMPLFYFFAVGLGRDSPVVLVAQSTSLVALFAGLIAFLFFGGLDALRHYGLRLVLSRVAPMPLKLVPLLDYMTRLTLLQQVGGGYVFRNSLLREYFENAKTWPPAQNPRAHP